MDKQRPLYKYHLASSGRRFFKNLGSCDIRRHQIGRKLDTLELEMKDLGERLDQKRFGEPRCTGNQTMSTSEQRNQQLLNDLSLPNDYLTQFVVDARACRA